MSSITTSRPAIYNPQSQGRQSAHPIPTPATPVTTLHPPAASSLKQHNGTASPATGYFGLVVDPSESTLSINNAKHNWSPSACSIKSTAAKSPRPVIMEGFPEPFQKQAQALAFTLHHHNLSNGSETGGGYSSSEFSVDNKSSLGHSSPSSYSPSHSFTEIGTTESDIPPFSQSTKYFDKPRMPSPLPMDVDGFSLSNDNLPKIQNFGALSLPNIPRIPLHRKQSNPKAATIPMCQKEKETDIPMITPDALAPLLKMEVGNVMLLDLRTYPQYSLSRIQDAVHLCIPTTLLKRPSFNVSKLSETFANAADKAKFAGWKNAEYIIVYDADSQSGKESVSAVHTVNKFVREGWTGHAYCVKGKTW